MALNHIMDAMREQLVSVIRKRTTSKLIDYGKNRLLNNGKDVTMLSETFYGQHSNLYSTLLQEKKRLKK